MSQTYPPRLCPRFDVCSVNNCPLDPRYPSLPVHKSDKERVCPMEKSVRLRIAAQFLDLLPMRGLTKAEFAAKSHYDKLSVADKAALAEKGKAALAARRLPQQPIP